MFIIITYVNHIGEVKIYKCINVTFKILSIKFLEMLQSFNKWNY